MSDGLLYGRTEAEWTDLEVAGWDFMIIRAPEPNWVTTYTRMNEELADRTGQPEWNFNLQSDRKAMGVLLGRLSERSFAETRDRPGGRLMISALCMYLDRNDVGQGFFGKAAELGLIVSEHIPKDAKDAFWIRQMNSVREWATRL